MTSTEQPIKISRIYKKLRDMAFQDPILADIATGKISWGDSYNEKDEEKYQDYITHGEGAAILNAFREALQHHISQKKVVQETYFKPTFPPSMQIQQVTTNQQVNTNIIINPNRVKTLIAHNLPRDITSEEISAIFQKYGPICDIYMPLNLDKTSIFYGTIRGYAFIKFICHTDSTRAFMAEQSRINIRGKMISIEFVKEDHSSRKC